MTEQDGSQGDTVLGPWMNKAAVEGPGPFLSSVCPGAPVWPGRDVIGGRGGRMAPSAESHLLPFPLTGAASQQHLVLLTSS